MTSAQYNMPMTVTYPPNCVGAPDRLIVILKYAQSINFTGAANPSAQIFAANSAFDPDFSGVGHQPSFYDKYTAYYGRYFVRRFKFEFELMNNSSSVPVLFACIYSDVNIGANTVEELIESKYSKWGMLSVNSGGQASKHVDLPWETSMKIMGQPYTEADDNMYAAVGASPADLCYAIIRCQSVDGTTSMTATARCTLYQELVFKDLLPQSSS